MEKILKILIGITIIFLLIGTVTATDINKLKVPDGWENCGDGDYHQKDPWTNGGTGHNMMIQKWSDGLKDEYYNNITSEDYAVAEKENNTYVYVDGLNGDAGCFEVVEIDGVEYFVIFWYVDNNDIEKSSETYDFLLEFNKLNNLKPIAV